MISFPWATRYEALEEDPDDFPYFKRWHDELAARPGVQSGMAAGADMSVDASTLSEEEIARLRAMLYNQRARPAPKGGLL